MTWLFHSSVNRKFSRMMAGLQEAAVLKRSLAIDELVLFDDYQKSTAFHLASREHIREAYEYEYEAVELYTRIRAEEREAEKLHENADRMDENAKEDESEAAELKQNSTGDNLEYIAEKLQGTAFSNQAEKEALQAQHHLEQADELEAQGKNLLAVAETKLNATHEEVAVVRETEGGLCEWVHWACQAVDRSATSDASKKPSARAIEIAKDFDQALVVLEGAKRERQAAMALLKESVQDVNQSIAILEDATNMHEKAGKERVKSLEYYEKAREEKEAAKFEEEVSEREEIAASIDKTEMLASLNAMSAYAVEAREEAANATNFDFRMQEDRKVVDETELSIRQLTFVAKKEVTHAGWYCLFSVLAAVCLCIMSIISIVGEVRNESPLHWLVRGEPKRRRDISYIVQHFLLLLLSMGFSGHLLQRYYQHRAFARICILVIVAMVGAIFQVVALHFIPNMIRVHTIGIQIGESLKILFIENVAKSGALIFVLLCLELLLLWVNVGTFLFSYLYAFNGWLLWIVTGLSCAYHVCFVEAYSQAEDYSLAEIEHSASPRHSESSSTEMRPLASAIESQSSASDSFVTLSSNPTLTSSQYGSTGATLHSFPEDVTSTFVSSWGAQVNRLRLLLDTLMLSWGLWIIRSDTLIVFRLSPISPGIVWGMLPLWSLGVVILAVIYLVCRHLAKIAS